MGSQVTPAISVVAPDGDLVTGRRRRRVYRRIERQHVAEGHDLLGDARRQAEGVPLPAEPLGSFANKSSPRSGKSRLTAGQKRERRERRKAKRRERHRLRYGLRQITNLKRVKDCGHVPITGDGAGPTLRLGVLNGQPIAGLSGLAHCGSVWACPVCSAKIATRRAEELADVMRWALEQGCSASMVTLTMRHHKGQRLQDAWDALSHAWARVTSGKQWVNDQAAAGLQGWVKAVEVTDGGNGWHVHVHVLMIWRGTIDEDTATTVGERMWGRWARALRKKGFDSILEDRSGHRVGLDVRIASLQPGQAGGLHEYFVKLSHEITGGQAKVAKGGGRTPFQLLTDGLATGLANDIERWWEWEAASKGRRQIAWSKGLRDWARLEPEESDDDIANKEIPGEDVVGIEAASWRELRRDPERVCTLLEVTEAGGLRAATAALDDWGYAWTVAKRPPITGPPPPPHPVMIDLEHEVRVVSALQGLGLHKQAKRRAARRLNDDLAAVFVYGQ